MAMRVVYVGDAGDLRKRLRQHCGGNVEASALRKHVAHAMGLGLSRETRANGKSVRVRIDLPDPAEGEGRVSAYLREGTWRVVACVSAEEARDFQWFAIDRLNPTLNRERRMWVAEAEARYEELIDRLRNGACGACGAGDWPTAPGVYTLWHDRSPGPSQSS